MDYRMRHNENDLFSNSAHTNKQIRQHRRIFTLPKVFKFLIWQTTKIHEDALKQTNAIDAAENDTRDVILTGEDN